MDAQQSFTHFVQRCLSPEKARRFSELAATKKGQRKILDGLCHEFEPAILPSAVRRKDYDALLKGPALSFMHRWDSVLSSAQFAMPARSCHWRTVGSYFSTMHPPAFIDQKEDGMTRTHCGLTMSSSKPGHRITVVIVASRGPGR